MCILKFSIGFKINKKNVSCSYYFCFLVNNEVYTCAVNLRIYSGNLNECVAHF